MLCNMMNINNFKKRGEAKDFCLCFFLYAPRRQRTWSRLELGNGNE